MFPTNSVTFYNEYMGIALEQITTGGGPFTILNVSIQQSSNSITILECGNTPIAKNISTNFVSIQQFTVCEDNLIVNKTGNGDSRITVTYAEGDFTNTTYLGFDPTFNIASTSDVKIYGSISAGELVISILLLMILFLSLLKAIAAGLSNIRTSRKFLQYGGGDVPLEQD